MRTYEELQAEVSKLNQLKHLDAQGTTVKLITLIALEWVSGVNPIAPSTRLIEVHEEMAFDGAVDIDGDNE